MKTKFILAVLFIAIVLKGCKEEYPLPGETRNLNLLVVEGILNSGTGPTTIRLSRSFNPTTLANVVPELRAQVSVEGERTGNFQLSGNNQGEYSHSQLLLDASQKYRLRITTTDGKQYESDFVPVQVTPEIDSVHWERTPDAIQIKVSTHDPQNATRYYRWEFDETWEIHSAFSSMYQYVDPSVVPRPDPNAIYFCWRSAASTGIFLNSSAKLTQDIIAGNSLNAIPLGSEPISVRYSVLVRQYSLSKDAYQFWEIMKKNTEQVGTLFDPQPSQILSNIHAVGDPNEKVIGFVSAGTIAQKRLFITRREVEPWRYFTDCEERVVPMDSIKYFFPSFAWIPLQEYYSPVSGRLEGYTAAVRFCADCRVRGTNIRPSFW